MFEMETVGSLHLYICLMKKIGNESEFFVFVDLRGPGFDPHCLLLIFFDFFFVFFNCRNVYHRNNKEMESN